MTKVALLLSGRIKRYEENLLPTLREMESTHDISLFASINGDRDDYHMRAEELLSPWLAGIRYEVFSMPPGFKNNNHPQTRMWVVNGAKSPYNILSCFYNDRKAFEMAESSVTQFETFCKLRTDIRFDDPSGINISVPQPKTIHSCIPPCQIYFNGDRANRMCISDAFAYGDRETMSRYTETFETILKLNDAMDGDYRINYELALTESFYRFLYTAGYYATDGVHSPGTLPLGIDRTYLEEQLGFKVVGGPEDANLIIDGSPFSTVYFESRYDIDPKRHN